MMQLLSTGNTTVQLLDKLDSENVSEIESQLLNLLQGTNELTIDLNELDHIDIAGIFMLYIFKQKAFINRKKVELVMQNDNLRKVIQHNRLGYLLF